MGTEEISPATNDEGISELESKIIRQVEYYFGDYNLCRDRFLKYQIKENDGWITLETLTKFNRLKQMSGDIAVIATALRKSPNKLLEVNDEGTQIRRSPSRPLPDETKERRDDVISRSVYAKGFKCDTTLDELLEFFKKVGSAENIQMRRYKDNRKKFKGSVFVTFDTVEEAKKFLEEKVIEYKGTTLAREMKKDYLARKDVEFEDRKKQIAEKRAKKEQKAAEIEKDKKEDSKEASETTTVNYTKGCLLKLSGFSEGTTREDIKPILECHGTISYIDFRKDDPEGVIRFESPVASEVLEKVSKEVDGLKKIRIKDDDILASVIEGEIEEEYYRNIKKKFLQSKNQFKSHKNKGKQNRFGGHGKRRGGFRKGKGNKRKFDSDNEDDQQDTSKEIKSNKRQAEDPTESSPKKVKAEDPTESSPKKVKIEDPTESSPKKVKTEDSD